MKNFLTTLAAMLVLLIAAPAHATLIGDTVSFEINLLGFNPPDEVVEEGVVEIIDLGGETINLDWEASSIQILFTGTFVFASVDWIFGSLDWLDMPSGVIDDIVVTTTGTTAPLSSFGDHSVTLEFNNLVFLTGQTIDIQLITSHDVPELTTIAILGLGLAGLGFNRKQRKVK